MTRPRRNLTLAQAAAHLGVSAKTLRIYERGGLLVPGRTAAGWRVYTPDDLRRAAEVVTLRAVGLGLAEVARLMAGSPRDRDAGLAAHAARLKDESRQIAATLETIRRLRSDAQAEPSVLAGPEAPPPRDAGAALAFALPWPWGGERFEWRDMPKLTFVTGPLGSGKTRFVRRLAEVLPDAAFLGLDRLSDEGVMHRLAADAAWGARVERALAGLAAEGAERSHALLALVAALEHRTGGHLVIDMVEQGLSAATQTALLAYLRARTVRRPALVVMTRSSSILDLDALGPDEAVIYCPANHGPPFRVSPEPGGRGTEAVATCLATPLVRARTAGVVAIRSQVAGFGPDGIGRLA